MGLVSLWICLAKFSICLGSTVFLFSISPFWNGNVYPMPIPLLYFGNTQFVWFHRFTVVEEFCLRLNHISSLTQVQFSSVQFSSVAQSCLTLCDPMNRSTPGLPIHHQLLEFTQTHVHRVSDAIQTSHPLSAPSPPAPNPSQHESFPMSQLFA